MIPLNARRLTKTMLRQIGKALGVPSSSSATCAELKLMVEGKLTELGYDPLNVQVILSDEINGAMFLVNDEGIIKCVKNVATNVSDVSLDDIRSALHVATEELDQLCTLLESKEDTIRVLEAELVEAQETIEQLKATSHTEEVERLRADLGKEVLKSKRFWKLRCDQMLKHEEEMTAIDTEVVLLKARLLTLEVTDETVRAVALRQSRVVQARQ